MKTQNDHRWVADLGSMTCRNTKTNMTVQFEKKGELITGSISEIPDDIKKIWILSGEYFWLAKKVVIEAEDVFLKAYFDNEMEKRRRKRVKTECA